MGASDRGNGRGRDAPPREAHRGSEPQANGGPFPPPRRNVMLAIVIALIVFVLLVGLRVMWGDWGGRRMAPAEPPATEEPATPPAN